MGCGSSSEAVAVSEPQAAEAEKAVSSDVSSMEQAPGSSQAVAAAASKLRSEVEAQSMAEKRRLQSAGQSEPQEAVAEQRLREMEEALAQLLNLIELQKCSGSNEQDFEVHVPPPGGPHVPDHPAAIASDSSAPASLPVALSDSDAAALKEALAACDENEVPALVDQAERPEPAPTFKPMTDSGGLCRTTSVQSTQSTLSIQSDETINSSEFGSLDPDVVSSSSLLRLNGILKRLDALELQAAFEANGGA